MRGRMFQFIQIGLGPHLIYRQLTAICYCSNGKVPSNIIAIIILPSDTIPQPLVASDVRRYK
jgi:hypothetical protein